jgi:hypothetical protein
MSLSASTALSDRGSSRAHSSEIQAQEIAAAGFDDAVAAAGPRANARNLPSGSFTSSVRWQERRLLVGLGIRNRAVGKRTLSDSGHTEV